MLIDAIVLILFIGSGALGFRNGFFYTALHTCGWAASVVLAFFWCPAATLFLRENTPFYDDMFLSVTMRLEETATLSDFTVPQLFAEATDTFLNDTISQMAEPLTDFLFCIVTFLALAVLLRILFSLILRLTSHRRRRSGFLSFADGIAGLGLGFVKGVLLAFLFLAALTFVETLPSGTSVSDALAASAFAATLYENNFLLHLIGTLL